jgi:hypothetical protein
VYTVTCTMSLHLLNHVAAAAAVAVWVVGQIIPWNFPLLMAAWKVSIACGLLFSTDSGSNRAVVQG